MQVLITTCTRRQDDGLQSNVDNSVKLLAMKRQEYLVFIYSAYNNNRSNNHYFSLNYVACNTVILSSLNCMYF